MSLSVLSLPVFLAGGLLMLQASTPAVTPADGQAASAAAPTDVAPVDVRGSRKVCIRQGSRVSVGSRIRDPSAKVVCKTRAEWQADVDAEKQDMQRIFADVPTIMPSVGGPAPNCANAGVC